MKAPWSHRRGRVPANEASGADSTTLARGEEHGDSLTALYVTSPHGGTRHLLPPGGLIRLGRAADSTIVIDDPRASRAHATLKPTPPFAVSDLGSVNGTFVGRERLAAGTARALALGETFFIGDSALVLRPSGLHPPAADRFQTLEQLTERFSPTRSGHASRTRADGEAAVILKIRASRPAEARWVEATLGSLLVAPFDWMSRLPGGETAVGLSAASMADGAKFERTALERLGNWSIAATVESVFLPSSDAGRTWESLLQLVRGDGVVRLQRGAVILRDPAMLALKQTLERIAPAPVSVLVLGETGVGKDVVASMIHELSSRAARPFVRLNCASLPEGLLESELFGHERGAFTGAVEAKEGLLESADGGTVFLDEIGDLAFPLQAKVLRAIESCEITRVGGVRPRRIDVRFVAATNRDLVADVREKRFRADLYHRLNGVTVTVPSLRKRRLEIEPLARHFLDHASARFGVARAAFSPASFEALRSHAWPGNVRQLRNVVERAVLLTSETVIEPWHLGLPPLDDDQGSASPAGPRSPDDSRSPAAPPGARPAAGPDDHAAERERIEEMLIQCSGNQTRAAELLGIPRRTFVRRIRQLGLRRPRK